MKILILTDYREQFWLTTRHKQASFHVDEMVVCFETMGHEVLVRQFSQLDLGNENYQGWCVVYQSTEDPYLLYNGFIEDCLLALREQRAILVPDLKYNRAHHNKVFMELLRSISGNPEINMIHSKVFGTFNEYEAFCNSNQVFFPQIVKLSEGSGSKNVIKINDNSELVKVRRLMKHKDFLFWLKDIIKGLWSSRYPNFKPQTNARRKIIVQNFIDGLSNDYKVLVFGNKYYVLQRGVRPGDFRASGSGLFEFPEKISEAFLDFAERTFKTFHVPFISMDLAQKNDDFYLIEFQFVSFGTYTLEKAKWHFERVNGVWKRMDSTDNLEEEFCKSVDKYLTEHLNERTSDVSQ